MDDHEASVIDVDGDSAGVVSDWLFCTFTPEGGWSVLAGGRYEDDLVRTPQGWKFRCRRDVIRSARPPEAVLAR